MSIKRLAPPRPAAAPEKPGADIVEQSERSVVWKDVELVKIRCAGLASLETLCEIQLPETTGGGDDVFA